MVCKVWSRICASAPVPLVTDIDVDVPADAWRRRFVMTVVPAMCVVMVGVVVVAFVAARKSESYGAQEEGEAQHLS